MDTWETDSFVPIEPVQEVAKDMQNETNRMLTFASWPQTNHKQPRDLVPAGFFYTGQGDKVQCFSCLGYVEGWNINEDPWIEHATHHPHCQYVIDKKGHFFIDSVTKHEYVQKLKESFTNYALTRGFSKHEIDEVLDHVYESEAAMRDAVLRMSDNDYHQFHKEAAAYDEDDFEI